MTDAWTPENLPIMLSSRSLLASSAKPIKIGSARVTADNQESLVALDKMFQEDADRQIDEETGEETLTMKSRYEVDAGWLTELTDLPYQVTYYFPSSVRSNRVGSSKYGAKGLTYRVLYEALCNAFNGGVRFIDSYFLSAFRDHMGERYEAAIRELKQRIVDEAQARRKSKKAYLRNYDEWVSPMTTRTFEELGRQTKADIIASLASGRIPLQKSGLSKRTMQARAKLGISSDQVFYATGRLINSIVVSVILLSKDTAAKEEQQ